MWTIWIVGREGLRSGLHLSAIEGLKRIKYIHPDIIEGGIDPINLSSNTLVLPCTTIRISKTENNLYRDNPLDIIKFVEKKGYELEELRPRVWEANNLYWLSA